LCFIKKKKLVKWETRDDDEMDDLSNTKGLCRTLFSSTGSATRKQSANLYGNQCRVCADATVDGRRRSDITPLLMLMDNRYIEREAKKKKKKKREWTTSCCRKQKLRRRRRRKRRKSFVGADDNTPTSSEDYTAQNRRVKRKEEDEEEDPHHHVIIWVLGTYLRPLLSAARAPSAFGTNKQQSGARWKWHLLCCCCCCCCYCKDTREKNKMDILSNLFPSGCDSWWRLVLVLQNQSIRAHRNQRVQFPFSRVYLTYAFFFFLSFLSLFPISWTVCLMREREGTYSLLFFF